MYTINLGRWRSNTNCNFNVNCNIWWLTIKTQCKSHYISLPLSIQTSIQKMPNLTRALCIRRTRTDADGRGRTRTDADIFIKLYIFYFYFFFAFFCWHTLIYGANWNETQSPTVWVTPPPPTHHDLMKIYWVYHPDSTTTLAQRRQRWHGRRWHTYVGTTSAWSPSAQLRWCNVI